MRIYRVERTDQNEYDEFDSFVVIAESEEDALAFHPNGTRIAEMRYVDKRWPLHKLTVEDIGQANDGATAGVVLASFNAG